MEWRLFVFKKKKREKRNGVTMLPRSQRQNFKYKVEHGASHPCLLVSRNIR